MLKLDKVSKPMPGFAIRDVSFVVGDGEYFVLLGRSGAGKTLVLEIIAGLILPDSGRVFLDGSDITRAPIQSRRLGLVFQDQALFPHLTVRRNIEYGLRCAKLPCSAIRNRVTSVAEEMGISHLLDRMPTTISGGEAQRVALARTLATEPRCLLLDEPISSLDADARAGMRALLRKLNHAGNTVVHVTHDYEEAISLASRVAIMEHGTIVQVGTPDEVFHHPKSEFVASFLGVRNFFKGELRNPAQLPGRPAEFIARNLTIAVLTNAPSGPGCLMFRSEDVTLSNSRPESSALNAFQGIVTDIANAPSGVEVTVDIGVQVFALISANSLEKLKLECGKNVWASFKASAGKFIGEIGIGANDKV